MTALDAGAPAKTARTGSARPGTLALLLNNRLAALGLVVLAIIALLAVLTPLLPLDDPAFTDPANRLLPPGTPGHLLGTDHLGRDILSRLLWGTRVSIAVGLSATAIAAFFGSLIGLVAGYAGGLPDTLLMRSIDMLMAFPYILLALGIVAVLGVLLFTVFFLIALALGITAVTRPRRAGRVLGWASIAIVVVAIPFLWTGYLVWIQP